MLKRIVNKLKALRERCYSMEEQAKRAGVKIGHNNQFFSPFWSSEPYLITIGDNCQTTKDVKIFTHGGSKIMRVINPKFDVFGKVTIGNNVYIGNNALIMPGVSIGNNVLVAAGSVVCHSVPDNVVVGGNPARILSTIEQYKQRNLPYNTNTKGLSCKDKQKVLMQLPDSMFVKKRMMAMQIK